MPVTPTTDRGQSRNSSSIVCSEFFLDGPRKWVRWSLTKLLCSNARLSTNSKRAEKETIRPSQVDEYSNRLRKANSIESRLIPSGLEINQDLSIVPIWHCDTNVRGDGHCEWLLEQHFGGSPRKKEINSISTLLHLQGEIAVLLQLYCASHLNHFLGNNYYTATSGTANTYIYIYSQIDRRYKSTGPSGPLRGALYVQKDCTREREA